ncbi:hypothetical protein [Tissierella sp. Yu-01]|uniref:hypothetical protein n=1 Tax=Tissierella sp. Yu-01 TaxID=3035694 RepID=UPI00240DC4B8|nr:hypothetical protein [Tissierella sp. Yu-01]WFA09251.1 hypothetical protein P3962_01380 [Tissierella sp. Yu-01]
MPSRTDEINGTSKDKFGLSWQIVPYNMGDLIKTDAQVQAMMNMKKIIIKELGEAGQYS